MKISQGTAKISLLLNGILFIACLGLLIYANVQRTLAEQQRALAEKQRILAEERLMIAEHNRNRADSAAMVAIIQRDSALKARSIADSLMSNK